MLLRRASRVESACVPAFQACIVSCYLHYCVLTLQLWLNGNRLSGALPEAARESFNLNMLILEDNALTGRIPLSWTEFSNLSVLRVGGNKGLQPHREVELVLGKKWKTFDNAAQV